LNAFVQGVANGGLFQAGNQLADKLVVNGIGHESGVTRRCIFDRCRNKNR